MYPHCLSVLVERAGRPNRRRRSPSPAHRAWTGGPAPMLLTPRLAYEREFFGLGIVQLRAGRGAVPARRVRRARRFPGGGSHSDELFWLNACARVNVLLVYGDLFWYRIHAGPGAATGKTPPTTAPRSSRDGSRRSTRRSVRCRRRIANAPRRTSPARILRERVPRSAAAAACTWRGSACGTRASRRATGCGTRAGRHASPDAGSAADAGRRRRDPQAMRRPPAPRREAVTVRHEDRPPARLVLSRQRRRHRGVRRRVVPAAEGRGARRADCRARSAPDRARAVRVPRRPGLPVSDHRRPDARRVVPPRGDARAAEHLFRWLAAERPDILHVHSIKTGVGLPELREAHRLGIRVIATCHLPSLGYMCRTGELMEGGKHPCDGVVWPSQMRGVQPDARRPAAAGVAAGGRDSAVARRPAARAAGQGRHRARHERARRRVPADAARAVRDRSSASSCSTRRRIACCWRTDRRPTSWRSIAWG